MNLLRPFEVSEKLGITKAALPALRRREKTFPQPIKVSQKVLRWDEEDIDDWLNSKKEKTNGENLRVG
tara:strand:- start:519 stop:722 length:204 start_codon:yes stop_codon:yes gene_type:complete